MRELTKKIISDESRECALDDPMASKPSNAKIYQMHLKAVHRTINDTPGFSASRGLEEDRAHVNRIMETLAIVGNVNAVLLVINDIVE